MFLEVRADNTRAQRLYRWWGFAEIGIRRGYYQPSGTDAIVMRRDLTTGQAATEAVTAAGSRRCAVTAGGTMTAPLVLGIETSCDETGVGLVRGHELLADAVASSVDEHARFGGVVPEVASRAHLEAMVPTVDRALATAGVRLCRRGRDRRDRRPGPGRRAAGRRLRGQGLRARAGKPLYGVNHLAAHVAVDQLEHGPLPAPVIALLVSGGHSSLLLVPDVAAEVVPLGATIDDAAGEAFDKVARVLGLPFPGGPHIDRAAAAGDGAAIAFPRGKYRDGTSDFSFSGLKTAVARWVEAREAAGEPVPVADVAASFQEAVADVLTRQGRGRLPGARRRPPGDRRRRRGQLPAARAGRRSAARRPGLGCGCRGRACAPTTARWSPRSGPSWSPAASPPSALDFPADSSLPVTTYAV